ncbi:MAG: hypothetical protein AABZ73_07175 [Pseudomonadota bacterium]|uniref:hypothetical protein n=1 Tax=Sphingobium sp. TaxID=1912891 RepID=UPI002E22A0B2
MSKAKDMPPSPAATAEPDMPAPDATANPPGDTPLADAARKSAGKGVWMGTAVGIGSAAIVAALLYYRRKS